MGLCCGVRDLVPWPDIKARLPRLELGVLATGPLGMSQQIVSKICPRWFHMLVICSFFFHFYCLCLVMLHCVDIPQFIMNMHITIYLSILLWMDIWMFPGFMYCWEFCYLYIFLWSCVFFFLSVSRNGITTLHSIEVFMRYNRYLNKH